MPILDKTNTEIIDSKSSLSFATTGGGSWEVWDRYICIGEKPAYHIGNICGTCAFFFEKLDGAQLIGNAANTISQLNSGINVIDKSLLDTASALMPNGNYLVVLHDIFPYKIEPGDAEDYFCNEQVDSWGIDDFYGKPHHPNTNYYRLKSGRSSEHELFFEFLIPLFPQAWLNPKRVDEYKRDIGESKKPTVLTLSVFDQKQHYDAVDTHACLAHYLIDGHHKAFAAFETERPITALSFIALDKSISWPEHREDKILEICAKPSPQ